MTLGNVIADMQNVAIIFDGVSGGSIQDNLLGTDASGTVAAPDNPFQALLELSNSSNVMVGGRRQDTMVGGPRQNNGCAPGATCSAAQEALGPGNVIAESPAQGIGLAGGNGDTIQGNLIGTDITGEHPLPNQACGIVLDSGTTDTQIGGALAGQGNVISNNGNHGIQLDKTSGATIEGNFIGTDASGTHAMADARGGVALSGSPSDLPGPSDTQIGGPDPGDGNIISGNGAAAAGITVGGQDNPSGSVTDTTIEGNHIGTDVTGKRAIPNADGVTVADGATGVFIGGLTSGDGNLISGNLGNGIDLNGDSSGVQIDGNRIGTTASGTAALGNSLSGIRVGSTSPGVQVGGESPGQPNVIADNGQDGVLVDGAQRVDVRGNSIFGNSQLGIDLTDGGNASLAAPTLSASPTRGIMGTLQADPNTTYTIDFYTTLTGGLGMPGLHMTQIGTESVHTEGNGTASFALASLPPGAITATATDPSGDTSEFSAPLRVSPDPGGSQRRL
jgi:hypothetical protein